MIWGDCERVYNKEFKAFEAKHYKNLIKFISLYPDAVYENIWFDEANGEYFSGAQVLSNPNCGQNHNFISSPSDFFIGNYPRSSGWMKAHYKVLRECYGDLKEIMTTEMRCGFVEDLLKIKDQDSVLIMGGGPSTKSVDLSSFDDMPKWTMNNFYKNEKISGQKNIQLVSFLDNIDLEDSDLWDFMEKNRPLLVQEISDYGANRINHIKSKYDNTTYIHTRYRSRIGIGARLTVLAILMGIKNIYTVGMDGYDIANKDTHAFEKNKNLPQWLVRLGPKVQKQQMVVFWDYILNTLSKSHDFKIHDLAVDCPTNQCSFITRENL